MAEFFHLMTYPFLACLLIAGIHVYLGLHVISRKVIFVDLALAQIAALGAIYGVLLGYEPQADVWAVKGFSLLFAFLGAGVFSLTRMRHERVPHEAVIGITYAVALAATILASINLPHGADEIRSLLAGSILWVRGDTVLYLGVLYVAIGIFHYRFRDRFLKISLDRDAAEEEGISLRWWDFLFYFSFALVVTNSVAIGGVLLVFSYLVIPAVVAVLFARGVATRLVIGWIVGTLVSIAGVVLSYTNDIPSGPTIVVCFAAFLLLAALIRYVHQSASKAKSLLIIAGGALLLLILYFGGEALRKEDSHDLTHLLESGKKNERLMGLRMAQGDSAAWPTVLPRIVELLHDPDMEIRAEALDLAGAHGDASLSGEALDLMDDPEDMVREAAIECLKKIGDQSILDPLERLGEKEEDPYLRLDIADLMSDLGDSRGASLYVKVMDKADVSGARQDAYERLVHRTETGLSFDAEIPADENDAQVQRFRDELGG